MYLFMILKVSENDLMDAAFDKSWLGSLPRAKLDKLRAAHKVIIFIMT